MNPKFFLLFALIFSAHLPHGKGQQGAVLTGDPSQNTDISDNTGSPNTSSDAPTDTTETNTDGSSVTPTDTTSTAAPTTAPPPSGYSPAPAAPWGMKPYFHDLNLQ